MAILSVVGMIFAYISLLDGFGDAARTAALLFIFLDCLFSFLLRGSRVNFAEKFDSSSSYLWIVVGAVMPIFSVIVVLIFGSEAVESSKVHLQSGLQFFAAGLFFIYVRVFFWDEVVLRILLTFVSLVCVTLIFEFDGLLDAINMVSGENGRLRFAAFSNHPNMIGHIFSIGVLAFFVYSTSKSIDYKIKIVLFIFAGISLLFVIAASSRGAIIPLIVAILYILTLKYYNNYGIVGVVKKFLYSSMACILLVFLFGVDNFYEYIVSAFELDSEYRGVGTGGTGRVDNWSDLLAIILQDSFGLLFGNGIRSWDANYYGFATDNSYLNSLWESGIVGVLLLIFGVAWKFSDVFLYPDDFSLLCASMIIFVVIESMFARYMISIGNPGSIVFLMLIFCDYSKIRRSQQLIMTDKAN